MKRGLLNRLDQVDSLVREGTAQSVPPAGKREARLSGIEDALRATQEYILMENPGLLAGARNDQEKRRQLGMVVSRFLLEEGITVQRLGREPLVQNILSEIVGYGPLDPLLDEEAVTDILVNGPDIIYVERNGLQELTGLSFRGPEQLMEIINRMVAPLGRRIDHASPCVDARLPDGSRISAVIPPVSAKGPVLAIRKFGRQFFGLNELIERGTLSSEMSDFLTACVRARLNILVSGGTGSGKTTTLNALLASIANPSERIITIEDSAELQVNQTNLVSLETRPPGMEGKGEVTIRDLVRSALRLRPDRIIIGESRGAEAYDLLQSMNTGHEGSMSTVHANNQVDALYRLENMVLMAGQDLPHQAVREQINSALDLVIHQSRLSDGTRKIVAISLVNKERGGRELTGVFRYRITGINSDGGVRGIFETARQTQMPAVLVEKFLREGVSPPNWFLDSRAEETTH